MTRLHTWQLEDQPWWSPEAGVTPSRRPDLRGRSVRPPPAVTPDPSTSAPASDPLCILRTELVSVLYGQH